MAVDQEARDLINSILAEFATRWDGGTWGVPRDFSMLLRQEQPPASGASQFKGEDLQIDAGDFIYRDSSGDIVAGKVLELSTKGTPVAGDFVLLQEADGTFRKVAAESLGGGSVPTAGEIAAAIWDLAKSGHNAPGTFGNEVQAHALTSELSNLDVAVSSRSSHSANDVTGGTTVASAAATLAAEHAALASEHAALATSAEVAAAESNIRGADSDTLKTLSDAIDGIVPTAITLGAIQVAAESGNRVNPPITLELFQLEQRVFTLTVLDADDAAVDLTDRTLRFLVLDENTPPAFVFKLDEGAQLTKSTNVATVTVSPTESINQLLNHRWFLWDIENDEVLLHGPFIVFPAVEDG